ncbi:MAG: excinuclease ABC subunit UvrC [Thermodesulfobacteriota bacterium]
MSNGPAPFDFPQFLPTVPLSPGVYLMQDQAGQVLYVGKARELRKRLASYGRVEPASHSKTSVMLSQVARIDVIVTPSEQDALLLEASLIKQHRPRYNVILRDDKNYPLIKVTIQEEWPRLCMTRRRAKDGARYFGPFPSSGAMWETIRLLHTLFPLRRCKERVLKSKPRPCLNHQMGRCLAPCAGKVEREAYLAMVGQVLLVLEGRNQEVSRQLASEMEQAAAALRFEEAALLRDRLRALQITIAKQQMVAEHGLDQDVFGLSRRGASVAVSVILVRAGAVIGQQGFFLADPVGEDAEVLSEVLARFYEEERAIPRELLLPMEVADQELLSEWLSGRAGRKVAILSPQRGDRARLTAMASANAEQLFRDRERQADSWQALAKALATALHLQTEPIRIECLDISNTSGQQAVGSLVAFRAGEPDKPCFRHYRIRTVEGPNDYAMMAEVLARRFARGAEEDDLPELFMVDGGRGQLRMAEEALAELGLTGRVELVGIAKEREEEGEKLYRPGRKNPIVLKRNAPALLYLMRIRDEAHRFGITFHRKLRTKASLTSALDAIPGVGPSRRRALLNTLGSMRRVKEASAEELAAVPGIGPSLAAQIWAALHGEAGGE